MFKKLLVVAIVAAGAIVVQKKVRDQRAEQELWAEATDDVRSAPPRPASGKLTAPGRPVRLGTQGPWRNW